MIGIAITVAVLTLYALLIISVTIGWFRLPLFSAQGESTVKVSVIIPVRNEEQKLEELFHDCLEQDYSKSNFEIIFVDDHSEDRTKQVLQHLKKTVSWEGIRYISLDEFGEKMGKKAALEAGVLHASGTLIITTDADCRVPNSWISTLAGYYHIHKPKMMLAPVRMCSGNSLFGKLQSLEFASLVAASAGSTGTGFPLLANGANLAFEKKAFLQVGGYASNEAFASGDDIFLLLSIKKHFGAGAIHYIKSKSAMVSTSALQSFSDFLQQRLRWVSKNTGYRDFFVIASGMLVYSLNALFPVLLVAGYFDAIAWQATLIWIFIKMAIDLPLLAGVTSFMGVANNLYLFPAMELLNSLYTTFIGVAGIFIPHQWKGRRTNSWVPK